MNVLLWVAQAALAALYILGGAYKLIGPGPTLGQAMPGFSLGLIRLVGLGELLAGVALVLPAIARRWQVVAARAATLLAAEAVAFVVYHMRNGASMPATATFVLGLVAALVAWGRWRGNGQAQGSR